MYLVVKENLMSVDVRVTHSAIIVSVAVVLDWENVTLPRHARSHIRTM